MTWTIDLAPDPDRAQLCVCGWRGRRRDLTLHPRQGFGVCPRCWSRGVERITSAALKLVIFGSRSAFPSFDDIENGISQLSRDHEDMREAALANRLEVITGKCRGADSCGEAWARRFGLPVVDMPADWERHGRAAGPIRNRAMAAAATHGLGFRVPGLSAGTDDMQAQLEALGKPCVVLEWRLP